MNAAILVKDALVLAKEAVLVVPVHVKVAVVDALVPVLVDALINAPINALAALELVHNIVKMLVITTVKVAA